jgi:hypothetical protein
VDREEFIKQNIPVRIETLWNEGEVIAEKVYYDCNITLFLLDNFYVEVFYNRIENQIVSIEVQEDSRILGDYAKNVCLDELLRLLQ